MFESLKNIYRSFVPTEKRKSAYACAIALFEKLNVDSADDEDTKDYYTCHFDYQGAHFSLYASKKNSDLVIRYPWFMEAEESDRPQVSMIVNNMNVDYLDFVFMHTFLASENKVGVHLKTQFDLYDLSERSIELFKRRMSSAFNMQRLFVEEFEKQKRSYSKQKRLNIYECLDKEERSSYLLLENEQNFHTRPILHLKDKLTLDELLDHIPYRSEMADIVSMRFVSPDGMVTLDEEKKMRRFDLRQNLNVPDTDAFQPYAQILLRYEKSNVTIDFNREAHSQGKVVYYSVTLFDSWKFQKGTNEIPKPTHCIIAFDLKSGDELAAEVKYMRDDALDKVKEGKLDQLTDAQRMMKDFAEWKVSDEIYWGVRYYLDNRYVESIAHFEIALAALNPIFSKLDRKRRNIVYDIYYRIGYCYSSLGNYPKAIYYLDIPFQTGSMKASIEYINCLVNARDIRAYTIISQQLDWVNESMHEDEDEEDDNEKVSTDSLEFYYKFLLRRKAYVLIEYQEYDQAETVLKEMLKMDDLDMTDFAVSELSYIENCRKRKEEEERQEEQEQQEKKNGEESD